MQTVLDGMHHGISVMDGELVLVACNRRFGEYLDLPPELCRPGTTLEAIIRYNAERGEYGPGDVDRIVDERIARARLGLAHRFERVRPNGALIEIVGEPLPGGGFVTTYTPKTPQVEQPDAERVSRELLLETLEQTSDGFLVCDADNRIIYANAKVRRINDSIGNPLVIGTPFETFIRDRVNAGGVPKGFDDAESYIKWRLAVHYAGDRQFLSGLANGEWLLVRDHILPDGKRVTTSIDISDLKRTEEALALSEQRFRDFVDASSDRFWETDRHHRFTMLADTTGGHHGPPAAKLLGRTRWEHVGADPDQELGWGAHRATLDAHEPFRDFRYDIPSPAGQIRHWRISGVPFHDAHGSFQGYRGTSTDETEWRGAIDDARRDLERALHIAETANRAKSLFLATVSHELRTPLNAIIGFADLLRSEVYGALGDPRYGEYVEHIRTSGGQLLHLIEDVLDMSRIEMGQIVLRESWIDPSREIRAAVDVARARFAQPNSVVDIQVASDLPAVRADARLLRQIVMNLVSNSLKFSSEGGRVVVSAATEESAGLTITVDDNGVGIAPPDLEKILRPFEQIDGRLTRRYEGIGLGLPICKSFVELHGGTLEIESAVGQGTRATVRLGPDRLARPKPSAVT